jgi:hypothetical protein
MINGCATENGVTTTASKIEKNKDALNGAASLKTRFNKTRSER